MSGADAERSLGVAVVGAGVIGELHGQVLADVDGAHLACVVDVDAARARRLAERCDVPAVGSLAEALALPEAVDIAAVCTPSGLHAPLAIEAMEAGCHVLIEKPIDVDDERAAAIAATERRTGKKAAVVSQHRFDPASLAVLREIHAGTFGRLTSGIASLAWWREDAYYAGNAWRGTAALDGGGALMNQGIHSVDLLIACLGRPVEVTGYTARLAHEGLEVEDTAVGCIRLASGALGLLHATTAAYPGLTARVQIHGDAGSAIIDDDALTFLHRTRGQRAAVSPATVPASLDQVAELEVETGKPAVGPSHRAQYEDLVHAIRTGREVAVGTREARTALAVITGLYRSAREGRPVAIGELAE